MFLICYIFSSWWKIIRYTFGWLHWFPSMHVGIWRNASCEFFYIFIFSSYFIPCIKPFHFTNLPSHFFLYGIFGILFNVFDLSAVIQGTRLTETFWVPQQSKAKLRLLYDFLPNKQPNLKFSFWCDLLLKRTNIGFMFLLWCILDALLFLPHLTKFVKKISNIKWV